MLLHGLQKMTLLDYPGKVACTAFTYGCNFRCPFCHNAGLVVGNSSPTVTEEEFFSYLAKRKGILDGVCITGGEPTLHDDLSAFAEKIKAFGLSVKLDTNGSRPDAVRALTERGLVDYIAMDIKNRPEKYSLTAGRDAEVGKIAETVELLKAGVVDYEFRTTVVKGFHEKEDFIAIGQWLNGAKRYFLQKFTDSGEILGKTGAPFTDEEMKEFALLTAPFVPTEVRGLQR